MKIILMFLILVSSVFANTIKIFNFDGKQYTGEVLIQGIGKYKVIDGILDVDNEKLAFIKANHNHKSILFSTSDDKVILKQKLLYEKDYSLYNIKFDVIRPFLDIYVDGSYSYKEDYALGAVFVPYLDNKKQVKVVIVKNNDFKVLNIELPRDPKKVIEIKENPVFEKYKKSLYLVINNKEILLVEPKIHFNGKIISLTDKLLDVNKTIEISLDNNLYQNVVYSYDIGTEKLRETCIPVDDYLFKANNFEYNSGFVYVSDMFLDLTDKDIYLKNLEKQNKYIKDIKEQNELGNQDSVALWKKIVNFITFLSIIALLYWLYKISKDSFKKHIKKEIYEKWVDIAVLVDDVNLPNKMVEAYELRESNISVVLKKMIDDFEVKLTSLSIIISKYSNALNSIDHEKSVLEQHISSISESVSKNADASTDRVVALKNKITVYEESLIELTKKRNTIKQKLDDILIPKVLEFIRAFNGVLADARLSKVERELNQIVSYFNDKMVDVSNSIDEKSLLNDIENALSIERFKNELEEKLKKNIGEK